MFTTLRTKFGIPGVISVIALVFAMVGGAYAANNLGGKGSEATASAGKPGPRGKPGKPGKPGPAGPAGPVGAAGPGGPVGPAGSAGAKGATGATGVAGVTGSTGATGATGVAGVGSTGATGATGTPGSPWTAGGTLPVNSTETGGWAVGPDTVKATGPFFTPPVNAAKTAISFTIPLVADLGAANVQPNPVGYDGEDEIGAPHENCPGSAAKPKAAPGFLCVYTSVMGGATTLPVVNSLTVTELTFFTNSASATGAVVGLISGTSIEEISGWGSWAVTG
jgi:collagen triple helix repeat protein